MIPRTGWKTGNGSDMKDVLSRLHAATANDETVGYSD